MAPNRNRIYTFFSLPLPLKVSLYSQSNSARDVPDNSQKLFFFWLGLPKRDLSPRTFITEFSNGRYVCRWRQAPVRIERRPRRSIFDLVSFDVSCPFAAGAICVESAGETGGRFPLGRKRFLHGFGPFLAPDVSIFSVPSPPTPLVSTSRGTSSTTKTKVPLLDFFFAGAPHFTRLRAKEFQL